MSLSQRQKETLAALRFKPRTTIGVAQAIDSSAAVAGKVLASLYRRSLVAYSPDTDRWVATERGRKKVAA